jgi:hypothetical protein
MMAMPAPPAAPAPKTSTGEQGRGIRIREATFGAGAEERLSGEFEEQLPARQVASTEAPSAEPAPAYTGGLFRMGSGEPDRPSRNLDYLLEDDESKSHKGLFFFLGLIALLLAGGLGYLRFRNGALPNLMGGGKPAVHDAASGETSENSPSTDAGKAGKGDEGQPSTASTPAVTAEGASPASTEASVPPAPDSKQLTEVRPKNPAESTSVPAIAPTAATTVKPEAEAPETEAPKTEALPAPAAKPSVPPKPAPKPEDPVVMGEKYIYGRGVPQDCARGMKTVKPAADQNNSKAMITMGALYATGHCVSRDLPTAYRFFALALRKDPENAALKQNVEMVWSQMTQSERQQAIRLTQ